MASVTDAAAIDALMNLLEEGSRGRPPREKVRRAIGPDGRYPRFERDTRNLMQGDAVYGPEGTIEESPTTRKVGPGGLTLEETRMLRAMEPPKMGQRYEDEEISHKPTVNPEYYSEKYSGTKAQNDVKTGAGMHGRKMKAIRGNPEEMDRYTDRAARFGGSDFEDMEGKDILRTLGITKGMAKKMLPELEKLLSDVDSAEEVQGRILDYVGATKKKSTKRKSKKSRYSNNRRD